MVIRLLSRHYIILLRTYHDACFDVDLLLGFKELWEAVEAALTHLHPNYRMVVILADIEGFSYKEISELMGWPIGTVMSRLSRARSLLGRILRRYKKEI